MLDLISLLCVFLAHSPALVSAHRNHVANQAFPLRRNLHHERLHKMFTRQSKTDYPPQDQIGPTPLPAWVNTYNSMKSLIPSIPPSINQDGWPLYPSSVDTTSDALCSWTLQKCNATDIVDAPDSMIGISFDDGPQDSSAGLYRFLQQNNIPSTHFVIGSRILENPDLFKQAVQMGGSIAVHVGFPS